MVGQTSSMGKLSKKEQEGKGVDEFIKKYQIQHAREQEELESVIPQCRQEELTENMLSEVKGYPETERWRRSLNSDEERLVFLWELKMAEEGLVI